MTAIRSASRVRMPGPFAVLARDHARLRALFDRYEELGARSHRQKRALFEEIRAELDVHRPIEEEILYPAAAAAGLGRAAGELDAHGIIGGLLGELSAIGAGDRRFDVLFAVLRENVEQHLREEEEEIFPDLARLLPAPRLEELTRALERRHEEAHSARAR